MHLRKLITCFLLAITLNAFAQSPEEKLKQLDIQLPKIPSPIASYVNYVRTGNLLYLAGKGPQNAAGEYTKGKLGSELTIEQGYEAAKLTAAIQLAVIKEAIGDLSKVKRIVKVNGYVNSDSNFYDHPKVINGFRFDDCGVWRKGKTCTNITWRCCSTDEHGRGNRVGCGSR